eukprot:3409171-Pleurochrysis_carterae.AAC.1
MAVPSPTHGGPVTHAWRFRHARMIMTWRADPRGACSRFEREVDGLVAALLFVPVLLPNRELHQHLIGEDLHAVRARGFGGWGRGLVEVVV